MVPNQINQQITTFSAYLTPNSLLSCPHRSQLLLQNLSEADQAWMHQLGCLIFCTERAIKLNDLEASSGLASPLHGAVSESSPRDSPVKPSQDPQILAQAKEEVRLQLEGQMSDQEIAWLEQVSSTTQLTYWACLKYEDIA